MSAVRASMTCDEITARRVAMLVGEILPDDAASGAFEGPGGQWQVDLFLRDGVDPDTVRALVRSAGADATRLIFEAVVERDWVTSSLEGLKPVGAGRMVVHGAHDRARVRPNAIGIEIEAALAFGTGHHGTTLGCLTALAETGKRRHARRILDVGTGSGVLAIAAAKTFRRPVIATDIDPVAAHAAAANARLNAAAPWIAVIRADGCGQREIRRRGPFDLVFANILLGPLRRMATPLASLLAPGGTLILSGLLATHAHAALAAYRARGLVLERRILLDGWITLMMRRPPKRNRPGGGTGAV